MSVRSFDPRTRAAFGPEFADTGDVALEDLLDAAEAAAPMWASTPRAVRAAVLDLIADRLDAASETLVPLADSETALGAARLGGELARTTFQLRMFGRLLRDPAYYPALIDEPVDGAPPAGRPRIVRARVPLGPVAVFGASNFPFAFSVAGGDTASALAAGCPVLAKAHPAHPQLSRAVANEISVALSSAGAARGTFALVYGFEVGRALVRDRRVRAAAFTGSYEAGRALFDLAASRPDPIPFYGELGSVNPVFVTRTAATQESALVKGYLDSLTLSAGQFCTNPGVIAAPKNTLLDPIVAAAQQRDVGFFLHQGVAARYHERLDALANIAGARIVVRPDQRQGESLAAPPALLAITASDALRDSTLFQLECFGPAGVIVEYDDDEELLALADSVVGCLVATVHADADADGRVAAELVRRLAKVAGRIVWNGWPTGVAVSPAQHHGGPHPATTNALHTSVGGTAIDRFLRPIAFQSVPEKLLPASRF